MDNAVVAAMKRLSLAVALLLAPAVAGAEPGDIEYRVTRCASAGEGQFSVSFEGRRKEQRRIALASNSLSFGGDIKGQVALSDVKELRLSPILEVVFARAERRPLQFGRLPPECRRLIHDAAGHRVRIRDGEA